MNLCLFFIKNKSFVIRKLLNSDLSRLKHLLFILVGKIKYSAQPSFSFCFSCSRLPKEGEEKDNQVMMGEL